MVIQMKVLKLKNIINTIYFFYLLRRFSWIVIIKNKNFSREYHNLLTKGLD